MILKLFNSPEEMFLACSKDFINDVCHMLTHKKYYDVAMLGGSSSKDFFLAINKHNPNKLPIRVFFSDERFVPTDNENSNAYTALKFLDIDKNKIFPIYQKNLNLEQCAMSYESLLISMLDKNADNLPSFSTIYLGMGTDGHVASLFPEHELLNDKESLVKSLKSPNINFPRITFCSKLIKASNRVVIIAHGLEKKKIISNIISKEDKSDFYPVKKIIEENMAKITFFMA